MSWALTGVDLGDAESLMAGRVCGKISVLQLRGGMSVGVGVMR